jgi:hypothetical protein
MAAMSFPEGRQRHAIPRISGADARIKSGIYALDAPMHGWTRGRAKGEETKLISREEKKEEFPGIMENMPPGNSFPQICVVSVNESV